MKKLLRPSFGQQNLLPKYRNTNTSKTTFDVRPARFSPHQSDPNASERRDPNLLNRDGKPFENLLNRDGKPFENLLNRDGKPFENLLNRDGKSFENLLNRDGKSFEKLLNKDGKPFENF